MDLTRGRWACGNGASKAPASEPRFRLRRLGVTAGEKGTVMVSLHFCWQAHATCTILQQDRPCDNICIVCRCWGALSLWDLWQGAEEGPKNSPNNDEDLRLIVHPHLPVWVGHQWMVSTNTSYNKWLSLAKPCLKVPHVGRNRSLVARTSKCGWAITRKGNTVASSISRNCVTPSLVPRSACLHASYFTTSVWVLGSWSTSLETCPMQLENL